ncbi:MAG: hypothetical protein ACJ762_11880 [Solirubrobacteraceae bacterium]
MRRHLLNRSLFGVPFVIDAATADLAGEVESLLPPGHVPATGGAVFPIDTEGEIAALDAALRKHIATHAPDHVFVHAGVVAHRGAAIVLPAATHAGKSELVAALVRAGAAYCSDEYAVIDREGCVHPYARPMTLRGRDGSAPARVRAPGHREPLPVGLIVATTFVPGARWAPAERTAAEGALLLLAHAGQGRAEPARVLDALHRAAAGARVLEGPRGEADEVARALLG